MAKNDWIVAGLNNPTFTTSDFSSIADLTTDNTQLLSMDDYLKSDFIKNHDAFKDEQGNFSKEKFADYYKHRVADFGDFQQNEFAKGPALDMFDIMRTKDSPVRDINFRIQRGINPDRQAYGIEGVNRQSDPMFSRREIAKQNKVFNSTTGEFEDYTVNDHTLVTSPIKWLKDLFKDPLVLATWDEDGEHFDPFTGTMKEHKKGEEKLNDKGTYYYETLGNRSVLGKDVLSVFDTFTVDGEGLNKYDFLDSNDIQKSAPGVVAKTVASILPLFMGPVGTVYLHAIVAREMMKSIPMLYGMVTAFSDTKQSPWLLNHLAALGERFTTSTSDYAKQKTFAGENFGNLIADVATQWGQQKLIAKAFGNVRKAESYIKEAEDNARALYAVKSQQLKTITPESQSALWEACKNKFLVPAQKMAEKSGQLGRDMSLAYMAIISNTDVYQDMLDHGASRLEAATVALGSTLGMYGVDKYLHLGEVFFDEATPDATKQARQALKNEFKEIHKVFDDINKSDAPVKNKLIQYMTKAADASKRVLSKFNEDLKYHTLSMTGKMVGEGLEEVGEELVTDLTKSLYELAGEFGFNTSTKDVGAWDNFFDRYAMNFLGGFIGGGVFYGKEVWDRKDFHRPNLDIDIANLIRNGHADELRKQLATMQAEGKTGNKHLSATNHDMTDDNKPVWKTTEDEKNSQSQAIVNLVNQRIDAIEEVLTNNRLNLTDDELFDNMVLTEQRYQRYKGIASITNYYEDFNNVLQNLINAEINYKKAIGTIQGTANGTPLPSDVSLETLLTPQEQSARDKSLADLQKAIEEARKNMQGFLAGENSLDYTRKLNFLMDRALHEPFLDVDVDSWFQSKYPGKTIQQLTDEERIKFFAEEWPNYVREQLKTKATDAWEKFKLFEKTVNGPLQNIADTVPDYKTWLNNLEGLFKSGTLNLRAHQDTLKAWNDKLDTESDEDYNDRDTQRAAESQQDFGMRRRNRVVAIEKYNDQQDQAWVDKITTELQKVGMTVDPQLGRNLKGLLSGKGFIGENQYSPEGGGRIRQIINRKIETALGLDQKAFTLLRTLKPDLSNSQEILDALKTATYESNKAKVDQLLDFNNLMVTTTADTGVGNETMSFSKYVEAVREEGTFEGITIGGLRDDLEGYLKDPTQSEDPLPDLDENSKQVVLEALNDLCAAGNILTGIEDEQVEDIPDGVISSSRWDNLIIKAAENRYKATENTVNRILADIRNNPIYKLQQQLKTTVTNPIGALVKEVATNNNDTVEDVDEILNQLQLKYDDINDIGDLQLDDTQRTNLVKIKNYLNMLKVYIYAASTVPNTFTPVGHNRTINNYADKHKDRLQHPWEKLPEIDSDYAALYSQEIDSYIMEIDDWIRLSDLNQVDQIRKAIRTDQAFNDTLYKVLSKIPRTFTVGDDSYDLLEGIETVDTSQVGTPFSQVPLFNLERLFYNNVKKIADKTGMSIADLVVNSNILETLIPGIANIKNQKSTELTADMTEKNLTDYDKLVYFITLLSDDPARFYQKLNKRVTVDKNIVPITTQEYASRVAQTAMLSTFRNIFKHARSLMLNKETSTLTNSIVIPGVSGAGKTQVVLASIDQSIKDYPVFIAGPTDAQAKQLQNALNRDSSCTFEDLLTQILGKDQYNSIKVQIDKVGQTLPFTCDFFEVTGGSDDLVKISLKKDALTFQELDNPPVAIYLDEATHLNTVEAQIIDAYAESVGATVFMCGDAAQLGKEIPKSGIHNIDEGAIFAIRTPNLSVSLRGNNLQKFQNQEAVRTVLETVLQKRLYGTEEEYKEFYPVAKNEYSKFNFKVYNETELNGDIITADINDSIISRLKEDLSAPTDNPESKKTIAFIGDISSIHLKKLRDAGISISDENVHTLATMQGREYDYVVIDHNFVEPDNISSARVFLQQLYTLMTRARTASIFIDNNLSKIIGKNVITKNKSKAPSILAGIEELRKQKLEVLKALQLPTEEIVNPEDVTKTKTATVTKNPEVDFVDPDTRLDDGAKDQVDNLAKDDKDKIDNSPGGTLGNVSLEDLAAFPIEFYGATTVLSAIEGKEKETISYEWDDRKTGEHKTGKREVTPWIISQPTSKDAPLRNLQAIYPPANGDTTFKLLRYLDKVEAEKRLSQIQSLVKYVHRWPTSTNRNALPSFITENFSQKDWEKGTLELEFRGVTDEDQLTPIYSPYKQNGLTHKETTVIANLVFTVKNKKGQTCKFDIAGINNPATLNANKDNIKKTLEAQVNNPKIDEATKKKLQSMRDSIDNASKEYEAWFDRQIDKFNKEGSFSYNVSDVAKPTRTTWFTQRTGKPIRLGGTIDPAELRKNTNLEEVNTSPNFADMNPNLIISPIYTFAANEEDFSQIDHSLRGRAAVFISDDTLLDEDSLISEYMDQKSNPDEHSPKIRIIPLGNYGMTFSQFSSPTFIKQIQGGDESRRPFRQNFTGIRMFVSIWNTRAALIKFNRAYDKWVESNSFTEEQVKALMEAQNILYRNKEGAQEKANRILTNAKLNAEDLKKLDEFNNVICKDIPMFRLGHSENDKGFHIQRFNVKNSIAYDKDEVNLLVVTPERARTFQKMLKQVMQPICPDPENLKIAAATSLNVKLINAESKKPWGIDEFIDLKEAKHRRTLSGLLSKQDGTLVVSDKNGSSLAYAEGEEWSSIPRFLSLFVGTITGYQYHSEDLDTNQSLCCNFWYKPDRAVKASAEEAKQINDVKITISIADFFSDSKNGEKLLKETKDEKIDTSLLDLFDLMFHGTTEDIHRTYSAENPLMQLEDAYFKQGFFINPDISVQKSTVDSTDIDAVRNAKDKVLFYKIATTQALFTVDVDPRVSGFRIPLKQLLSLGETPTEAPPTNTSGETPAGTSPTNTDEENPTGEEENTGLTKAEKTFKNKYPEGAKLIDGLNKLRASRGIKYIYTKKDLLTVAKEFNAAYQANLCEALSNHNNSVTDNTTQLPNLLKWEFMYNSKDDKIYTLAEYLTSKGFENPRFNPNWQENPTSILVDKEGKTYLFFLDNPVQPLLLESEEPSPTETDEGSKKKFDSRFDKSYEPFGTLGNAVENIIIRGENFEGVNNANEFRRALQDVMENSTSEDDESKFLTSILDNNKFEDCLDKLNDIDEHLYDKLFVDCY